MAGHLFIMNGDLTQIACDAILIPTSGRMGLKKWRKFLHRHHEDELNRRRAQGFGDNRLLALDRIHGEPRVWLGNIAQAGDSADFSKFEPYVEEFVTEALAKYQRIDHAHRIHDWLLPRLAVNVVGSGHGGGTEKKGELISGLVRVLSTLARRKNVDIILVTYGAKPYAAAQRARRKLISETGQTAKAVWPFRAQPDGINLHAHAERLANHAIKNHLVLFIGAGISNGAGLPLWQDLLTSVAKKSLDDAAIKELHTIDSRDQATILERRLLNHRKSLRDDVAALLDSSFYSLGHGLLASLPSKEAVTTNFDRLFEMARMTAGQRLAILPDNPINADGHWLLKLHGTVNRRRQMILTRSDYLDMPRQYGALMGLVQGLLMMRHMMFVGYSLQDEDFHELIHEVRVATKGRKSRRPLATVLTLREDNLQHRLWKDELQFVPMTTGSTSIIVAARQLEIFLDLVGYLSTTSAAFFLDPTYAAVSGEPELRALLSELAARVEKKKSGSVGYKVRQFLEEELGAEYTRVSPRK